MAFSGSDMGSYPSWIQRAMSHNDWTIHARALGEQQVHVCVSKSLNVCVRDAGKYQARYVCVCQGCYNLVPY